MAMVMAKREEKGKKETMFKIKEYTLLHAGIVRTVGVNYANTTNMK